MSKSLFYRLFGLCKVTVKARKKLEMSFDKTT